jgi:flagellar biosynthesis GTPase FlhF
MSNAEQKKSIPISTIPTSKLTIILNNFLINTVNHLNKLSLNVDEKLSEFDKKMNDLEIMTTLFEAKLDSLPEEIKSTYPPLQQCNLDDVNPVFSSNIQKEQIQNNKEGEEKKEEGKNEEKKNEEEQKEEEQKEEEKKQEELTPEEELENFLKENEEYRRFIKQLKIGIKSYQIEQKERINGLDMDIFNEMLEKAKKVYPNIS